MSRTRKKNNLIFTLDWGGCSQKSITHHKNTKCAQYVETGVIEEANSSWFHAQSVQTPTIANVQFNRQ
ncbi:hypothetical protein H6S82_08310 [Planktothrix sp. FACHB-1355]|uniref:Uncharacterized protein n=1 Tax=Aerosakkonema funiforme FACHB-1375 TaxID=2949571 RepID=A0A926VIY5_9CYAN|nr:MULTISPECIES: hypothetical protein [Oscillatoriales]MBD2184560.1 hypothetical protein [Aerosakkonema funiforme FACHB-1375]MBD3558859.1 hypothetical protein [Planktothrix sp. FACHB-1355]